MSSSRCKAEQYHIARVPQKPWKSPFFPPALAWVTAERHVSSDERRRVSLRRISLTLSDSSVPGQFRHTDIKHIKCLSQHFTWHCSSTLICYPWRAGFKSAIRTVQRVKRSCNEIQKIYISTSGIKNYQISFQRQLQLMCPVRFTSRAQNWVNLQQVEVYLHFFLSNLITDYRHIKSMVLHCWW